MNTGAQPSADQELAAADEEAGYDTVVSAGAWCSDAYTLLTWC
jgi:alkanesulfonate monooxygenase SsuD/methylene tetrahydromethanopterin reductase-like flavin-dependent oxidoreductase (luciferase family)